MPAIIVFANPFRFTPKKMAITFWRASVALATCFFFLFQRTNSCLRYVLIRLRIDNQPLNVTEDLGWGSFSTNILRTFWESDWAGAH
ncbi:hypothetical protein BDP81DRAFT_415484 [Colletotrichum phormii]|uniref:Uncharacterized protein n=1 Tax=Colletotrichum phormii TaxID=359342 RepID=A0AAJ0A3D8_9PEZI|nr:uncharacterized protein BDP81DRAFT_415484 [Colletotrichum phormii]KAK1654341.1 hypothetical protein BDP81DRAFT_415484 [Colletotrichum phormii]